MTKEKDVIALFTGLQSIDYLSYPVLLTTLYGDGAQALHFHAGHQLRNTTAAVLLGSINVKTERAYTYSRAPLIL
jgi:hypothetical protein